MNFSFGAYYSFDVNEIKKVEFFIYCKIIPWGKIKSFVKFVFIVFFILYFVFLAFFIIVGGTFKKNISNFILFFLCPYYFLCYLCPNICYQTSRLIGAQDCSKTNIISQYSITHKLFRCNIWQIMISPVSNYKLYL